ncbi:MAG: Hsp33 family molecular chaperone HslO [Chthoniobacterales bacterium]|nr:Hsp33 family molecular chaperone HslO [Chthoniobacterales bacterium]
MKAAADDSLTAVASRFVRGRNALLCSADFGPMLMEFYLHFGQNGIVLADGVDEKLKLLIVALSLHVASGPRAFTCAWTLHLEEEGVNLFAVAEGQTGRVTGQAFDRDVRSVGGNVLHAETVGERGARRRSSVEFSGADVLSAAEAYYRRSEQRPARYFDLGGDDFALLSAQPDCDLPWLESVETDEIRAMIGDVSRPPLEIRHFRFECGCTPRRIAEAIGAALREDLDTMMGTEGRMRVICPRCGRKHTLTRADFTQAA